ncbi:MAG: dockerin type I repeat-containing protein [bacterium]
MMARLALQAFCWIGLCLILAFPLPALAEQDPNDPGEADTVIVRPYSFVQAEGPWPDSIGIPVEIWADDTVEAYNLGLKVTGPGAEYFRISSIVHSGPCNPAFNTPSHVYSGDTNAVIFGWVDFTGGFPCVSPQGQLATIYLQVDPAAPIGATASLDSTFVAPAGFFVFVLAPAFQVTPQFYNGSEDGEVTIVLGVAQCGDADGDGEINISDAIFLIQYIFAGGPAPSPLFIGDADCSGGLNISDVVYLINYIFAGGPVPCDPNDDDTPDC